MNGRNSGESNRKVVLDTETTGLEVLQGHRIIEIGCVEVVNRRLTGNDFHRFVNPGRMIDAAAIDVHGITNEFLADKPAFEAIAQDLWDYIGGDELVIHNATFDVSFLDDAFARAGIGRPLNDACQVTDTVTMARKMFPGQKANLDALCRRFNVDNSNRALHGALLDARLLADVYLAMTGGQSRLVLDSDPGRTAAGIAFSWAERLGFAASDPVVIRATEEEVAAHLERLKAIDKKSGGKLVWSGELAH
jgi:DNA polymerase-3 subunit epsilon